MEPNYFIYAGGPLGSGFVDILFIDKKKRVLGGQIDKNIADEVTPDLIRRCYDVKSLDSDFEELANHFSKIRVYPKFIDHVKAKFSHLSEKICECKW